MLRYLINHRQSTVMFAPLSHTSTHSSIQSYGMKQHSEQWSPYTNNGGTVLAVAGNGVFIL